MSSANIQGTCIAFICTTEGFSMFKVMIVLVIVSVLAGCGSSGGAAQPIHATLAIAHYTDSGTGPDLLSTGSYPSNSQLAIMLHVTNRSQSTVEVQNSAYGRMMFSNFRVTQIGGPYHSQLAFDPPGGPPVLVFAPGEGKSNIVLRWGTNGFSPPPPGDYLVTVFCTLPDVPGPSLVVHIAPPTASG
jgi:hypothetical protein